MAQALLQTAERQERLATGEKWSNVIRELGEDCLVAWTSEVAEMAAEAEAKAVTEAGTGGPPAARRRKPDGARQEDSTALEVSVAMVAVSAVAERWGEGSAGPGPELSAVRVRPSCLLVVPAVVQTREPGRPSRPTAKAGLPHMERVQVAQLSWQTPCP